MLGILRRRNFALLWLGGLISMAGDWALYIAAPFALLTLPRLGLGGALGDLRGPVILLELAGGLYALAGVLALRLPQPAPGMSTLAGAVSEP